MNRQSATADAPSDKEENHKDRPGLEWDLPIAAQSGATVLLTGSKDAAEALAYRIHSLSDWRYGPFVVVDCGWPEARIESLLLGTAVTDPARGSVRYLSAKHGQGGTVLLQEVGRLSATFQSVLADRLAARPGLRRRLIASTSAPLLPRVDDGTFDDRLYYRLNVIHIVLPETGGH